MRSAAAKSRFSWRHCVPRQPIDLYVARSTLRAAISEGRSFSASLSSTTTKTLSKVARNSSTAATSPWRNSPLSTAIFASRTRSNAAASGPRRIQVVGKPRVKLFRCLAMRAPCPLACQRENFPRFSRSAKFRSRSTELAPAADHRT